MLLKYPVDISEGRETCASGDSWGGGDGCRWEYRPSSHGWRSQTTQSKSWQASPWNVSLVLGLISVCFSAVKTEKGEGARERRKAPVSSAFCCPDLIRGPHIAAREAGRCSLYPRWSVPSNGGRKRTNTAVCGLSRDLEGPGETSICSYSNGVGDGLGQGGGCPGVAERSNLEMSVNRNWPDVNMGKIRQDGRTPPPPFLPL